MSEKIWRAVTRYGQGPRIWLWPILLYILTITMLPDKTLVLPWYNFFVNLLVFALLGSYAAWSAIKYFFFKERPKSREFSNWLEKINAWSFPSIHSSNMMILILFFVRVLFEISKHSNEYDFYIGILFILLIIITSAIMLSRIELHKHYPIDVLGGIIFWMLISGVVWMLTPLLLPYIVVIFGANILLITMLEVLQQLVHRK